MRNVILCVFLTYPLFLLSQTKSFKYTLIMRQNVNKALVVNKKMILDYDGNNSIFRSIEEKKNDSIFKNKGSFSSGVSGFEHNFYIIKRRGQMPEKVIQNLKDLFILKISDSLEWKINDETKKIGDFICQKATLNYGGRNWTAWFTAKIPVSDGPYIFSGLPGLIIDISDTANDYHFYLTGIFNSSDMFNVRKGLEIDWADYEKLALQYYNEPYKNIKPNSAGITGPVKYLDDNGNITQPNFREWTISKQKSILSNNNPIEINHKIQYK